MSVATGQELLHPVQQVLGVVVGALDDLGDPERRSPRSDALWSLGDREVDALLVGLVSAADRIRARALDLVTEAQRRNRAADAGATSHRAWLAGLLHVAPAEAGRMIGVAATLAAAAADPVTAPLVEDVHRGTVPVEQALVGATALASVPEDLSDDLRDAAVTVVRTNARVFDPAQLRQLTERLVAVVDPERGDALLAEQLRRAERRAHALRELVIGAPVDGQVHGRFVLPTADAATLSAALDSLAKPSPARPADPWTEAADQVPTAARDERTPRQRNADALVELARRALAGDDLPDTGGHRPQVVVTVDLEHLRRRVGAGTTIGGSALSVATARRVACDAGILPVVLGSTSQPLDIGRETRVVPAGIRRALVLRDGGCAFPGCGRPPNWCDAHHVRHWADGGVTAMDNLVLLCAHHHRTVHAHDWTVTIAPGCQPRWHPPGWPAPRPDTAQGGTL